MTGARTLALQNSALNAKLGLRKAFHAVDPLFLSVPDVTAHRAWFDFKHCYAATIQLSTSSLRCTQTQALTTTDLFTLGATAPEGCVDDLTGLGGDRPDSRQVPTLDVAFFALFEILYAGTFPLIYFCLESGKSMSLFMTREEVSGGPCQSYHHRPCSFGIHRHT